MRRRIKNQTQRQLKVVAVILIVYYYLYGVSGDRSQFNMWLHFILYKHTQAEMQIMTSSANLGFTLQLQTKHRQCDGVSVSAWCSCTNFKVQEWTIVQIQNLGLFMDLCTYIFDKPLYLTFALVIFFHISAWMQMTFSSFMQLVACPLHWSSIATLHCLTFI